MNECCKVVKAKAKEYIVFAANRLKSCQAQTDELKKELEVKETILEKQRSFNKKIIEELRRDLGVCRARILTGDTIT